MKYALVNNKKNEAHKGLIGYCPICSSELIAKCGEFKINHWAHKKKKNCDNSKWFELSSSWLRFSWNSRAS